jgi:hypothetical protein
MTAPRLTIVEHALCHKYQPYSQKTSIYRHYRCYTKTWGHTATLGTIKMTKQVHFSSRRSSTGAEIIWILQPSYRSRWPSGYRSWLRNGRPVIDSRRLSIFYFLIFSIFWGYGGVWARGVIDPGYLVIEVLMQKKLFHHLYLPVN